MADYKDIITGTLNNIVGKVKEVADSGAIKDIYEHGANRAKSYGQMAKLSLEINGDSEELKRVYAETAPAEDADFESIVDATEDDGTAAGDEDGIEIEITVEKDDDKEE